MPNLQLNAYDMSAERGYLCQFNAEDIKLTGELAQARDVAMRLPQILPTGQVRHILTESLPSIDMDQALETCSDAQARRLMVHYSFMVQSYVWGEPKAPTILPKCLAMPMVAIADLSLIHISEPTRPY